ncbi:DUF3027 domain-containing protein [Jatrophihabitans lederbergiae]|uniref:DUF3027 domain-containing protein n=1 Tax=Jatrophihabitans lederbergiae TaxID=3075547 RepID=A0ABU2J759_9ACTN|nr:DUF3027 domain-containing protein [Jatrophihabitans sp. DSM 44399]MDT0260822.1 DUF3027 domain-containing protein [Jatrophihabitans sp. DSM 44399]
MTVATEPLAVDPMIAAAVDLARAAAVEMAGSEVGEHQGVRAEAELAGTHAFAASLAGYAGWHWAVTLVRAPDSEPTVAEVVLLPGDGALLAPAWTPWSERLQPGDLSPGDLLPVEPDDPRLVPAYVLSDDPQVEDVAFELGLGRVRVLSRFGRLESAERWYAGDSGPDTPMARQAPAHCGTCGFFLPLADSLRAAFGVCANEYVATDGRIVAVEFGCGAHSDTVVEVVEEDRGDIFEDDLIDVEANDEPGEEFAGREGLDEQLTENELPDAQLAAGELPGFPDDAAAEGPASDEDATVGTDPAAAE